MILSSNNLFHFVFLNSPIQFEYIFGNISFILLFIAVILYWFDFDDIKQGSKKIKSLCMVGANLSLTLLLIVRWWESGHFPLSNLYESLIGLSWSFTTVHLIIILTFRTSDHGSEAYGLFAVTPPSIAPQAQNSTPYLTKKKTLISKGKNNQTSDKIGAITAPTALLTSVFATFFLPPEMLRATTLIPALKSNWLTMHVTVMLISYAFLLIGSLLSIALCAYKFWRTVEINFLFVPNNFKLFISAYLKRLNFFGFRNLTLQKESVDINYVSNMETLESKNGDLYSNYTPIGFNSLGTNLRLFDEKNLYNISGEETQWDICLWLNTMSYRILGLGFPLLTIGILSGAVWANEAWGAYWSWDPKETWALITWLVFAVYFHSRYKRSSEVSIVPATIASIGFIVIWICYLGVNLLQSGLHSYGWFAT